MVGSVITLQWMPGTSWKQKAFALGTGTAIAFYAMPFALEYWSITTDAGKLLMGFSCGIVGPNLLSKTYSYVAETTFGELLSRFWSKRT
jgi:hypothetical protein